MAKKHRAGRTVPASGTDTASKDRPQPSPSADSPAIARAPAVGRDGWRPLLSPLTNPSLLMLTLAALFSLSSAWVYCQAPRSAGIDFYQFWVVGKAVGRGIASEIYSDEMRAKIGQTYLRHAAETAPQSRYHIAAKNRQVLETYSTPLLYATLHLLAPDDYEKAYDRHQFFGLLCMAYAVVVFGWVVNAPGIFTVALFAALCIGFEPLYSDLRVANVNQIQLGLLATFVLIQGGLRWRYREALGGAVIGFAVLFKPNLLFVALTLGACWLVDRRWQTILHAAAGAAAAGLMSFLASALLFGSLRCWFQWLAAVRSLPDDIITLELGNMSWCAFLRDRMQINAGPPLLVVLLTAVVVALWLTRLPAGAGGDSVSGAVSTRREATAVAMGCVVYLLSAKLVWLHYYLLVIPCLILASMPGTDAKHPLLLSLPMRHLLVGAAFILVGLRPLLGIVEITALQQAVACNLGSLILFALVAVSLFEARPIQAADTPKQETGR